MIQIQHMEFRYPRSDFKLQVNDLQIARNHSVAIVGPSGSGKTTLLHLMAGILTPESGTIHVADQTLTAMSNADVRSFRQRSIGLIFQNFELIDYLSVVENVLLPCRIGAVPKITKQHRERASRLLKSVGLEGYEKRSVLRLSQGERQRVAICRALMLDPSVILADEPTGNLDPVSSRQVLEVLLSAVQSTSTTLVMVTHDHSLLSEFDDTVDFEQFLKPTVEVS